MEKKFKALTFISFLIFVLLMLPVLYLSFVNRATGDDYGYAIYTRTAWMGTHSLMELLKASWRTINQSYYSFQGTWFSLFLFTIQPEVFSDGAYVIVAFLMLSVWIGSTFYLFNTILCRNMGFNRWSYMLITAWFLMISIEFIPSTRSSIFWFNGCVHYMLPFAMCQITVAWLLKYAKEYRQTTFAGILIFMTLLGGSNYQAALFTLIVAFYMIAAVWFLKKDKRIFTLMIPMVTELAGLIVSMKSPGNRVRAGGDFGFSFSRGIATIGYSFVYAIKDIGTYIKERPLIFAGLLFLFAVFLITYTLTENIQSKSSDADNLYLKHFKHPVWLALMLFCLYSAMQAPALYAGVEVSGGVPNTNYQVFLLTASGLLLIIAQRLSIKLRLLWKDMAAKNTLKCIVLPILLICLITIVIFRSNIKSSASFVSLEYITSGQASDYKEQMDLQTRLMEDESTEDVVVPYINDVQGPLMHMPVTDDPNVFTNYATREFYGKNSVIAMDRPAWIEMYGELWQ
ncbi:MAG: hypothetical protein J1E98_07845 [Lachnospiraceae bacterium]|nr:hypothetical protein [Lachnospiraceae bacterium]